MQINRAGFCKCPFHGDHDASMKVYRDPRRGYHCFGCHAGGDVVDLAMRWYGLPFRQSLTRAAEDFGVPLPDERKVTDNQRRYAALKREMTEIGRQIEKLARQQAEDAYWDAFDAWWANDRVIREQAPSNPLEPFSDAWCDAVRHREEIKYNLEIAEERRDAHYARR